MQGQEGIDFIRAPHRVDDPDLERAVYGAGDKVPMADAIRYGLVDQPAESEAKAKPKGRRKRVPAEGRARKPSEDR